jgi:diguanylate cyclase (GGDEF)-like protein
VSTDRNQQQTGIIKKPRRVVNICFIVVFLCSTLLTWREMVVLENAYIASQRNVLGNLATSLDRHLQHSIDNLFFYRNTMRYALQYPISTDKSRQAITEFNNKRGLTHWQIRLDTDRSMPINGVSDTMVESDSLLIRDEATLYNELSAALELSYILQLSDTRKTLQFRTYYVSRAGYFISSMLSPNSDALISRYYRHTSRSYFTHHDKRQNHGRGVRWEHSSDPSRGGEEVITASVPLDYNNRWYGVLAMDFTIAAMNKFLVSVLPEEEEGAIILYDKKFNVITATRPDEDKPLFTPGQLAQIAQGMEKGNTGEIRFNSNFVTWSKLNAFDGVLIKTHTLDETVRGEFGRISIVLALLWLLFTLMLLGSWIVIRRLVNNMMSLQSRLAWRANYDTLTRLYNRGAFFEQAQALAARCKLHDQPISVIQFDLDYFKSINDRFGHDAGDRVLSHVAGIISHALRGEDIAGRVGGEEFCVVLPGATLAQAGDVAERVRERFNHKELLIRNGTTLHISASFGVSASREDNGYDFECLQTIADRRLYKAKQSGRNRVCTRG